MSMQRFTARSAPSPGNSGMSLIEILVAVSILAVLTGAAMTAARQDTRRADVSAALEHLNGVLDLARWEARSKATHVWVCLKKVDSGAVRGMQVMVFGSRDGTSDGSSANLQPLVPKKLLKNIAVPGSGVSLTPDRLLQDYATSAISDPDSGIRSYLGGSTWNAVAEAVDEGGQVIGFTPSGEAFIPGSTSSGLIEVLIEPFQDASDSAPKSSSLLVSCSTGSVQIYR